MRPCAHLPLSHALCSPQLWSSPGAVLVIVTSGGVPVVAGAAEQDSLLARMPKADVVEQLFSTGVLPVAVATRALVLLPGCESPATRLVREVLTRRHVLRVVGVADEGMGVCHGSPRVQHLTGRRCCRANRHGVPSLEAPAPHSDTAGERLH